MGYLYPFTDCDVVSVQMKVPMIRDQRRTSCTLVTWASRITLLVRAAVPLTAMDRRWAGTEAGEAML